MLPSCTRLTSRLTASGVAVRAGGVAVHASGVAVLVKYAELVRS
jgi:hypothetical protein